jgi:ABC-type transporter Mla MlaB component
VKTNKPEQVSLTADHDRLRVAGSLDFTTAAGMTPRLSECIAGLPDSFTVDLSGLTEFNSAVLTFMLDCVRLSRAANKLCRFSGATPALGNMLKMASLSDLILPD